MKRSLLIFLIIFTFSIFTEAQTTAFNFQGRLNDGSNPVNGRYDLQFLLFDSITGGNQVGATVQKPNTVLINGVFSTQLDFGASAFSGGDRFLEIQLRPNGSNNAYIILGARQQLLSVPYSVRSLNATNANNAQTAVNATTAQTSVTTQNVGSIPANRVLATDGNGNVNFSNLNLTQSLANNGLPKAIIHLDRDGGITGCYNAITGQSTNGCGFTTSHPYLGGYYINVGFNIVNRPILVAATYDNGKTVGTIVPAVNANEIIVVVSYNDVLAADGENTNAPVTVVVY